MPDPAADAPATVDLAIAHYRPAPPDAPRRPDVRVGLERGESALHVRFDVWDVSLLARRVEHQAMVCRDSCVEFFFEPEAGGAAGYLNLEVNCIGAALLHHHPTGERNVGEPVDPAVIAALNIETSLPREPIDPERRGEVSWWVRFAVPFDAVAGVTGRPVERVAGPGLSLDWRGNFYKCADESRHPHWGAWSPITGELDFHRPDCFAAITFDEAGRFVSDPEPG